MFSFPWKFNSAFTVQTQAHENIYISVAYLEKKSISGQCYIKYISTNTLMQYHKLIIELVPSLLSIYVMLRYQSNESPDNICHKKNNISIKSIEVDWYTLICKVC